MQPSGIFVVEAKLSRVDDSTVRLLVYLKANENSKLAPLRYIGQLIQDRRRELIGAIRLYLESLFPPDNLHLRIEEVQTKWQRIESLKQVYLSANDPGTDVITLTNEEKEVRRYAKSTEPNRLLIHVSTYGTPEELLALEDEISTMSLEGVFYRVLQSPRSKRQILIPAMVVGNWVASKK